MSMNEDTTRDLPGATPFEQRMLAEFAALNRRMASMEDRMSSLEGRMTSLEDKVDSRLRETRPIWEGVNSRLAMIEEILDDIRRQLGVLVKDLFHTRVRVDKLEDEQRPPAG